MEYSEFIKEVKKVGGTRNHKIKNSLGVYDAYKYIRKNKWFDIGQNLTEELFYFIIRNINKLLAELLKLGIDIKLPERMGYLEVRKKPIKLSIINGHLIVRYPVDWDATLKLWYEDEECFKNKTIIRKEKDTRYLVYYNKKICMYKNQYYFDFKVNREIALGINRNAALNKIEAFTI